MRFYVVHESLFVDSSFSTYSLFKGFIKDLIEVKIVEFFYILHTWKRYRSELLLPLLMS